MTALYSQAVWCATKRSTGCDFPVVRVTTATLLEQILAKVFDKEAPLPVVSPRAIKYMVEHGERPCLFLDEIDKFNPTQSRLDHLLEIVNCVYDSNGQLSQRVIQILKRFRPCGKYHGDALLRRIGTEPDDSLFISGSGVELKSPPTRDTSLPLHQRGLKDFRVFSDSAQLRNGVDLGGLYAQLPVVHLSELFVCNLDEGDGNRITEAYSRRQFLDGNELITRSKSSWSLSFTSTYSSRCRVKMSNAILLLPMILPD